MTECFSTSGQYIYSTHTAHMAMLFVCGYEERRPLKRFGMISSRTYSSGDREGIKLQFSRPLRQMTLNSHLTFTE